jgi:hypothetical protein
MRFVTWDVPMYNEAREGLTVYSPPMLRFFTTKEGTWSWSSGIVARIAVSIARALYRCGAPIVVLPLLCCV